MALTRASLSAKGPKFSSSAATARPELRTFARLIGAQDHLFSIETLEPWNLGTLEPWNLRTLEPWILGTLEEEPWSLGALEPWNLGTLEP